MFAVANLSTMASTNDDVRQDALVWYGSESLQTLVCVIYCFEIIVFDCFETVVYNHRWLQLYDIQTVNMMN